MVSGPVWTSERRLRSSLLLSVVPSRLGGSVDDSVWCAASGPVCCVWSVSVLASVRGLGTGVDVGAAAPDLPARSGAPSCLGRIVVNSCGARPRGRRVVLGCMVFASFLYKLAVWVSCIGFWPVSLLNRPILFF